MWLPSLPDSPYIAWATAAMAATVLIDVSADIGEYLAALDAAPRWTCDKRRLRSGRAAVFRAALEAILGSFAFTISVGRTVAYLTRDVDHRMVLVLGGLSRLMAATIVWWISIKTPQWVGVYHSEHHDRMQQKVDTVDVSTLRFHVRWSVVQYFAFNFFLNLPFAGRPLSILWGFAAGFVVSVGIYKARRIKGEERKAEMALGMAVILGFVSAVLFSDGCHYIQVVWGKGRWMSEWALGLASFVLWFGNIIRNHRNLWFETGERMLAGKRVSVHDRRQRMPMSLVLSHMFGSKANIWQSSRRMTGGGSPSSRGHLEAIREGSREHDSAGSSVASACADLKPDNELSTWDLMKMRWRTMPSEQGLSRADVALWVIVSSACLFIVIVNIGATAQMAVVKENFHAVHETLYGHINEGPVCAFKKVGGDIATFDSQKKAHKAGYKVAHCGACGECSDWHNMRLQHTTRTYLAAAASTCAKKSLYGGPDAVTACLNQPPVEFRGKCAECWTEDIICARNNCAFIFLQSNLINTVGNFEVAADTITAATCEEAQCELVFVPCSGANRRRMSIQSMIQRPGAQLCDIVDVDWAEIFGEGGEYSKLVASTGREEL